MKYRLVATAGHVDHGKTSLLKELTGQETDRLDEEQERKLTIDLGFADLTQDAIRVGFIDVPGHQNFVKNMVSGVGSVQGILFVVSAIDGWQEQSTEHFEIIRLLEPDYCCFALSKIDLADEDMRIIVKSEIKDAIQGTPFSESPIIPVSSETNTGLEELRNTLIQDMKNTPDPPDEGKPYCPIDRVFSLQGQGTVVTGSLSGGSIYEDTELMAMPTGDTGRIRSIQQYHQKVEVARPGGRVALNIPDWHHNEIQRGEIATVPQAGVSTNIIDGLLETPREIHAEISHNTELLAYSGTSREKIRLLIHDKDSLESDQKNIGRLKWLNTEAFLRPGDRIILRDSSDRWLVGCFTVLITGMRGDLHDNQYAEWLKSRIPVNIQNLVKSELDHKKFARLSELSSRTRYSLDRFENHCANMDYVRIINEDWLVEERSWEELKEDLVEGLQRYHKKNTLKIGKPISELQERFPHDSICEILLGDLTGDQVVERKSDKIRLSDFQPQPSDSEKKKIKNCLQTLNQSGLESPDRDELEERFGQEIISYLIQKQKIVELSEDRLISKNVLNELKSRLEDFIKTEKRRVSDIRDFLNSSRKYVIPLMEYLDRSRVTIRDGDFRYWNES